MSPALHAEFNRLGLTLTAPEARLVAAAEAGEEWTAGQGVQNAPEAASEENTLRGVILATLIQHRLPHDHGVRIVGAWISGTLSLCGRSASTSLFLRACRFAEAPIFDDADCAALGFSRCRLPGFEAERLKTRGALRFNRSVIEGELRLRGACIGGVLDLFYAGLIHQDGAALNADRARIDGAIQARGATVAGEFRLLKATVNDRLDLTSAKLSNPQGAALNAEAARIDGALLLRRARVSGEVWLAGAEIGGALNLSLTSLTNPEGVAFCCRKAKAELLLFQPEAVSGAVDLLDADFGALADAPDSWPAGVCAFDGMTYRRLHGVLDPRARVAWLEKQHPDALTGDGFAPQPWKQLAKTLHRAGKRAAARKILHRKGVLEGRALRAAQRCEGVLGQIKAAGDRLGRALLWPVGGGYKPGRAAFLAALWTASAAVFFVHAPMTPVDPAPPEPFQPLIYALDQVVPLVPFGQDEAWRPTGAVRWARWLSIVVGHGAAGLIAFAWIRRAWEERRF